MFDKRKKDFLDKVDKSKKGSIDKEIRDLIDLINSKDEYYTTSSCSGRIVIMSLSDDRKKNQTEWLFAKHGCTEFDEVCDCISNLSESNVWFQFEPAIFHIACRTIDSATELIKIMNQAGFKRTGIISASKRIIVEIIGSEKISTIIADKNGILVSEDYIKVLLQQANKMMVRNLAMIKKLEKVLEGN